MFFFNNTNIDKKKYRNFGFAEDTHARKNSNIFGFSLTKSYLCIRIELHTK